MEEKIIEKTVKTSTSTNNPGTGTATVQIIQSNTQKKFESLVVEIA